MDRLPTLRTLGADQHGVVSRAQARELGFDRYALRRLVASGGLIPITPRVFRFPGYEVSDRGEVMSALLDTGDNGHVSHLT